MLNYPSLRSSQPLHELVVAVICREQLQSPQDSPPHDAAAELQPLWPDEVLPKQAYPFQFALEEGVVVKVLSLVEMAQLLVDGLSLFEIGLDWQVLFILLGDVVLELELHFQLRQSGLQPMGLILQEHTEVFGDFLVGVEV